MKTMTDKKELRKLCREKRNSIPKEERNEKSAIICEKLIPYLEDKKIFSYYPFSSEVDISAINRSFEVAYPVTYAGKYMDAWIPKNGEFIINDFGIMEPDPDDAILLDSSDIDVVIVPLLGFDEQKNRLGHGGGYYDRYLESFAGVKIGVAFDEQKVSAIEAEENDVRLDIIITDTEIIS